METIDNFSRPQGQDLHPSTSQRKKAPMRMFFHLGHFQNENLSSVLSNSLGQTEEFTMKNFTDIVNLM